MPIVNMEGPAYSSRGWNIPCMKMKMTEYKYQHRKGTQNYNFSANIIQKFMFLMFNGTMTIICLQVLIYLEIIFCVDLLCGCISLSFCVVVYQGWIDSA
jgi:hypothetical protein